MAKKSKYAVGKPFIEEVCDAIRHHIGNRKALESRRENAFNDRDAALAEKKAAKDRESQDYRDAARKHSDAIELIDDLSKRIKWHSNQVDALVENADEPSMEILYEMPEEPEKKPSATEKHQMSLKGDAAAGDDPKDARPVGRPRAKEEEPAVPVGENQHLLARVIELDVREQLATKLIEAGIGTIGALKAITDADDIECGTLAQKTGLDGSSARQIKAALERYLKKHLRAEMAAEGIGGGSSRDDRAEHGKGAGKSKRK